MGNQDSNQGTKRNGMTVVRIRPESAVFTSVGRPTPAETLLSWYLVAGAMIDGSTCPDCGGHVSTADGTAYVCDDCGRTYDSTDLFLP